MNNIVTAVLIGSYSGLTNQTEYMHRKFDEKSFFCESSTELLVSLLDAERYLQHYYKCFKKSNAQHLLLHVATFESYLQLERLENDLFHLIPIVFSFDDTHHLTDLPASEKECLVINLNDYSQIKATLTVEIQKKLTK
jgi:hypothetical protein